MALAFFKSCGGGGGGSTSYDGRIVDGRVVGIRQRSDGAVLIWGEFVHCGAAAAVSRPNIALLNSDLTLSLVGWKLAPVANEAGIVPPSPAGGAGNRRCPIHGACFDPAGNIFLAGSELARIDWNILACQIAALNYNGGEIPGSFGPTGWYPPFSTFPYHFSYAGTPSNSLLYSIGPSFPGTTQRGRGTLAGQSANVAILTAPSHGIQTGQLVTISNVHGSGYNLNQVAVTAPDSNHVTYPDIGADEAVTTDGFGILSSTGGPILVGGVFDTFGSTTGLTGLIQLDANGNYLGTWPAGAITQILDLGPTPGGGTGFAVLGNAELQFASYQNTTLVNGNSLFIANAGTNCGAMQGTALIVAGGITRQKSGGQVANGIMRVDSVSSSGFGTSDGFGIYSSTSSDGGFGNTTNVPSCVAVDGSNRVYCGSNYQPTSGPAGMQTYGGTACNTFLLRLTSAGLLDTRWTCDTNGPVWSICVLASGNILVGGDFTMVGPSGSMVSKKYLVELDSSGNIAP